MEIKPRGPNPHNYTQAAVSPSALPTAKPVHVLVTKFLT